MNNNNNNNNTYELSEDCQKWIAVLLMCVFLGFLGIHRFFVGKIGTGILYLLTLGLLGFGVIFDLILISMGFFTDKSNNKIQYKQN